MALRPLGVDPGAGGLDLGALASGSSPVAAFLFPRRCLQVSLRQPSGREEAGHGTRPPPRCAGPDRLARGAPERSGSADLRVHHLAAARRAGRGRAVPSGGRPRRIRSGPHPGRRLSRPAGRAVAPGCAGAFHDAAGRAVRGGHGPPRHRRRLPRRALQSRPHHVGDARSGGCCTPWASIAPPCSMAASRSGLARAVRSAPSPRPTRPRPSRRAPAPSCWSTRTRCCTRSTTRACV